MLKKYVILFSLLLFLLLLLSLWAFDKLMVLNGRGSSFRFFAPGPRPLTREPSPAKPLELAALSRSA